MKQSLEVAFPIITEGHCLEIEKGDFGVFDSDNEPKRCFIRREGEPHFKVVNPAQKQIYFLAIDKCLLHDDTQEHCDFAVFDDSTFCFVEIKKGHPEHKRRNQIKKKAYRQLKQTIAIFLNQGVDFSHIDLEAIVCLAGEDFHPVANSTSQDAIVEFLSLGAKLLIGEMKEF